MPVELYERWRRGRDCFFSLVEELRGRNRGRYREELVHDVAAAVVASRERR